MDDQGYIQLRRDIEDLKRRLRKQEAKAFLPVQGAAPSFTSVITALIGPVTNGGTLEIVSTGTLAIDGQFSFGVRVGCRFDFVDVNGNIAAFGVTNGGVVNAPAFGGGSYSQTFNNPGTANLFKNGANSHITLQNKIGAPFSWTALILTK